MKNLTVEQIGFVSGGCDIYPVYICPQTQEYVYPEPKPNAYNNNYNTQASGTGSKNVKDINTVYSNAHDLNTSDSQSWITQRL